MRPHPLITAAVLTFVVVAVAAVVVMNVQRSRHGVGASARRLQPALGLSAAPGPAAVPGRAVPAAPAQAAVASPPTPATSDLTANPQSATGQRQPPQTAQAEGTVLVTSYRGSARCVSWHTIEAVSEAAVSAGFPGVLAKSDRVWRAGTGDAPGNAHDIDDFGRSAGGQGWRERAARGGLFGAAWLGILVTLSLCPVAAALFFGRFIPLAATADSTLVLPALGGVGTGVAVLVVTVFVAGGWHALGGLLQRANSFDAGARRITGGAFSLVGIYPTVRHVFLS